MRLINVNEAIVNELIRTMIKNRDMCKCDRCMLDIAAVCLNNLKPNYVVSKEGEVIRSVSQQLKIDISREVDRAINLVASRPHHR